MNWLIDLGNTRLKLAPLRPDGRAGEVRAFAHAEALADAWSAIGTGGVVHLASVADAALTGRIERSLQDRGLQLCRVRTAAQFGRLRVAYAAPEHLGVDRFLALLAASERGERPHLIVSVGSALTVDLLAKDGEHVGGLIAATPSHLRRALAERFAALDVAGGEVVDFARDTNDALASGAQAMAVGLVERCLRRAEVRLGETPTVLLTGGGVSDLGNIAALAPVMAPDLVIEGLALHARGSVN